jgi:hypothetical protein
LSEKNLGPLRQGQGLDTTVIKWSKVVDSSRWGKRVQHHRQKSTTKNQAKKSSQMHECKLPLNKCISRNFSPTWWKTPLGCNFPSKATIGYYSSPLLVMHESSLQM